MTLSKLIESEIADFFAGFGGPGEPDIQSGEAQRLLTARLLSLLERRERDGQEPVVTDAMALAFHHAITDGCAGIDDIEEIKDGLRAALSNYAAPPAPVVTSEPVRYMNRYTGACFTPEQQPDAATDTAVYVPLFAEPPAPAEPAAYEIIAQAWRLMDGQNPETSEWHTEASRYLNACRAAMLNGGQA